MADLSKRFANKCRVEGLIPASGMPTGHVYMDTGSCSVHLLHGFAEEAIDRGVCVCIISSTFGYFHTSGVHSETERIPQYSLNCGVFLYIVTSTSTTTTFSSLHSCTWEPTNVKTLTSKFIYISEYWTLCIWGLWHTYWHVFIHVS